MEENSQVNSNENTTKFNLKTLKEMNRQNFGNICLEHFQNFPNKKTAQQIGHCENIARPTDAGSAHIALVPAFWRGYYQGNNGLRSASALHEQLGRLPAERERWSPIRRRLRCGACSPGGAAGLILSSCWPAIHGVIPGVL